MQLETSYGVNLAVAIVALSPFIVVTTADLLFARQVEAATGLSEQGTQIIAGLATAGYAFGALLGGDLMQRFRQRELFLLMEALFVGGCAASALATGPVAYGAGRVLAGLATGILLVAALPPVIQRFPPERMPITVIFINLGFFGAVCVGPLLGGWVAAGHHWRWFYGALGAVGALNLLVAFATLPGQKALNPGMRFDRWAFPLGFAATVLPFWAAGELARHDFASPWFAVPTGVGLICFVALLLVEYHREEPVSPVKPMWNTSPVVGTLVATVAGGAFVALLELGERMQMQVFHHAPLEVGLMFWPLAAGCLATAVMLGVLFRTRFLPLLVLFGLGALVAGAALLMRVGGVGDPSLMRWAAALLGLGAGATVSPGLYLAGLPLPSKLIGRVFALVELVRSLGDYMMAPVLLKVARLQSHGASLSAGGVDGAVRIVFWLTIGFSVLMVGVWLLGGMGLPKPDVVRWIKENQPAFRSKRLLGAVRGA